MGFTLNISRLLNRHRAINGVRAQARLEAVSTMANALVGTLARISPHDTNRYVRGWILAGRAVGHGVADGLMIPPLNKSSRHDQFIEKLEGQVARWEERVASLRKTYDWMYGRPRYTKTGRKQPRPAPYKKKLEREIAKAEKTLTRAREELQKAVGGEAVLLFGLFGAGDKKGGRKLGTTVRDKVYGGTGRIIQTPDATVLVLHNMEPHAKIVEKNKGTLKAAQAGVRAFGVKRAGPKYLKVLLARSGRM